MGVLQRFLGSMQRGGRATRLLREVDGGAASAQLGDVPPGLLVGVADVMRDLGIANGTICGTHGEGGIITLQFSDEIPVSSHQRLRNVLALHRHRITGRWHPPAVMGRLAQAGIRMLTAPLGLPAR
jgi:hypothetical protein